MGSLHICAPSATAKSIHATTCLDCKKRTRMLQFFTPWYGLDSTCLRCGRVYQDGEWCSLPFSRFARKNNIEMAKKTWRAMPHAFDDDKDVVLT